MKLKNAARRSAVIVIILILSAIIGHVYQIVWHKIDVKNHPREYSSLVEKYSAEYGVPEYVVYSLIHEKSGFRSNLLSTDGKVGLMQLSPDTFRFLTAMTKEEYTEGILYDPDTNIKYGTYMLSYLFTKYGRWKTAFAAYEAGISTVDMWLADPDNLDENGNLIKIPNSEIAAEVARIEEKSEIYFNLYYEKNN